MRESWRTFFERIAEALSDAVPVYQTPLGFEMAVNEPVSLNRMEARAARRPNTRSRKGAVASAAEPAPAAIEDSPPDVAEGDAPPDVAPAVEAISHIDAPPEEPAALASEAALESAIADAVLGLPPSPEGVLPPDEPSAPLLAAPRSSRARRGRAVPEHPAAAGPEEESTAEEPIRSYGRFRDYRLPVEAAPLAATLLPAVEDGAAAEPLPDLDSTPPTIDGLDSDLGGNVDSVIDELVALAESIAPALNEDVPPAAFEEPTPILDEVAPPAAFEEATPMLEEVAPPVALEEATPMLEEVAPPAAFDEATPVLDELPPPAALEEPAAGLGEGTPLRLAAAAAAAAVAAAVAPRADSASAGPTTQERPLEAPTRLAASEGYRLVLSSAVRDDGGIELDVRPAAAAPRLDVRYLVRLGVLGGVIVAAAMVAGLLVSSVRTPVYAGRTELLFPVDSDRAAGFLREDRRVLTHVEGLQSRAILAPVAAAERTTVEDLQEQLHVEVIGGSEIIGVEVWDADPDRAIRVASAIAAGYRASVENVGPDRAQDLLHRELLSMRGRAQGIQQRLNELAPTVAALADDPPGSERATLEVHQLETEAGVLFARIAGVETRLDDLEIERVSRAPITVVAEPHRLIDPISPRPLLDTAFAGSGGVIVAGFLITYLWWRRTPQARADG